MSDTADNPTREQSALDVARQTPRARFAPGEPVPNLEMWTLERKLGGGGFGEVWLVRHDRKGFAAVKFCTDPTARHQLVTHERAVVARVMTHAADHPNIVPLLECNLSGDIPWLMYEYVEGGTLAEAIAQWAALPAPRRLGRAVKVLYAISGALAQFHRLRPPLVHRDLKPQNVLMAGHVPRVTDFGIGGMATEAGRAAEDTTSFGPSVRVPTLLHAVGSSRYAPPEQFLGSPPSPRDDVYALGVMAYQMVLGDVRASPGPDPGAELRALKIPTPLADLTARSLALDPAQRPRDAGAWEEVLGALLRKKTVAEPPPARPADESADAPTDTMTPLDEESLSGGSVVVSQTLEVATKGRWYVRPPGDAGADWKLVAATPAEVRLVPGEHYRFSIFSGATAEDVAGLRTLAGLRALRYLNLSYCAGVTDAALAHVRTLTGLRQLYLRGCPNVTDAGLSHLSGLAHLRALELIGSDRITAAAVAELRRALPRCRIEF